MSMNIRVDFQKNGSLFICTYIYIYIYVKLLWHLLKSHRSTLGDMTFASLLGWIASDDEVSPSSLVRLDFVLGHMHVDLESHPKMLYFNLEWISSTLADGNRYTGKLLRNPLAIGTVLRLLRFLDNNRKDQWLQVLLNLTKSSRKCVSTLASLPEWQPCLFQLISETLELVGASSTGSLLLNQEPNVTISKTDGYDDFSESDMSAQKRLDLCLQLYSTLLGHLLRSGGDRVSHVTICSLVSHEWIVMHTRLLTRYLPSPSRSRRLNELLRCSVCR
jgi:hypothetical protein